MNEESVRVASVTVSAGARGTLDAQEAGPGIGPDTALPALEIVGKLWFTARHRYARCAMRR